MQFADINDLTVIANEIKDRANKVSGATNGNFAALDSNGDLTDSGHKHSDYLTQHQDISGKADLDENGKLVSSQKPSYTKSEVGLGNVDNTSDATKKTNFTGSIASENTGFVTGGDAYTELAKKVDKVDGKGLSSNDYTTTEKDKLAGIAIGAEVNVQSDWNQSDNTKDDYIKNKPANLVQDASYVHTDNNYTSDEKTKLSGIAANAEVNQNAFSNVKVGSTTIASGEKTATLELEAGSNITLIPDTANKKVVLSATDTTYSDATTSAAGLMSASDKTKLNGISTGATKTASSTTNGHIEIDDVDTTVYDDTSVQNAIEDIEDELSTDSATVEGNPINFSTLSSQNAESTIIDLEPIQDLHGYDYPWVGGAGKNKLPMTLSNLKAINTNGTWSGNVYTLLGMTFTIITDDDNNVIGIKANGTPSDNALFQSPILTINGSYILTGCPANGTGTTYRLDMRVNNGGVIATDTGNGTNVTRNADVYSAIRIQSGYTVNNLIFYPMLRLSTESDATFVPYTNLCPITGRTQAKIEGCGKNMFDEQARTSGYYLDENGNEVSFSAWSISDYIMVDGAITYFGITNAGNAPYACWYDKHKNFISSFKATILRTTIIPPVSAEFVRFSLLGKDIYTFAIYDGEDATPYEPYTQSNDLTISFGQTVYGGQVDVEKGLLVVEKTLEIFDGTISTGWEKSGTYGSSTRFDDYSLTPNGNGNMISNYLTLGTIGTNDLECMNIHAVDHRFQLQIHTDRLTSVDVSGLMSFFASNPLQVCYELATPITINLTPHTINLLKGVNNISTDGDKITLTYRNGKFATLDGAVPKMTFRGEDYTMGIDDIGLFLKNLTKSTKTYIADPLLNFDGTVATYKKIMKQWFINNGVNVMDSTGITYLCERWYEITKQGWKGGTSFPAVGVSTGSTGTRFDDNVDMSVTPSTDTSANTDTYQGLPLFAITDCNWELDSDGNILITAIDGITDNFVRDDPTKFVGVMQQTGWVKKVDDASTQKYYYADDKDAYENLVPLPEAIKLDGTVRSFVCHSKYMSGIVDSKMTCCSGVIPRRNISHDGLVTLPDNIGTQYSGGTSVDWSFLVWMQRIKYASLTSDGVLQGCCNYNYQYYVKVSETGVKRLILSSANGANLKVGSTVTFGAYAGNADRGQAATYSISGQDGAIITSIEDVTIDGTTYKAVYVDTTSTFDTVANGDATNGTTIVSTHHWISGTCDTVKGNDGSPVSATNGVYPAKLQGIEFMVGGYEVMADVIMNISGGYYNPYYARKSTDQATSITSSMVQSTLKCAQPSSDAWRYIQKHGFDGEIFYPVLTGTSSSEYMKDGFYENGTSTSTGTREWLAFGFLNSGSGIAGMSYLYGNYGLGAGWWYYVARLSCNGNRGILLTA